MLNAFIVFTSLNVKVIYLACPYEARFVFASELFVKLQSLELFIDGIYGDKGITAIVGAREISLNVRYQVCYTSVEEDTFLSDLVPVWMSWHGISQSGCDFSALKLNQLIILHVVLIHSLVVKFKNESV